jgi:hypothetical protein
MPRVGRLSFLVAAVVATAATLAVSTIAARADTPHCSTDPYTGVVTCIVVTDPTPAPGSSAPSAGGGPSACTWAGAVVPCTTDLGWYSNGCYWKLMNPQPPADDPVWQGHPPGEGQVYSRYCLWDPPGPGYIWTASPPPVLVNVIPPAATIALRAEAQLALPTPRAQSNASAAAATYVGVPTWLWVDPAGWHPLSASASVGTRAVTVTATPVATTWNMGDGTPPVTCSGPGEPFDAAKPYSPPCGHTYRTSSATQPQTGPSPNDRYFTVRGSVVFAIHWVCTGDCDQASGDLADMTWGTTAMPLRVFEVQTVVVNH